jgi:hypothetical protein
MRHAALCEELPSLDGDDDDDVLEELLPLGAESIPEERPPTRGHCAEAVRPCPWVSCRFHLYLDVRADGVLRVNFPDREPDEMLASCAIDLAEDGPRTLEQVAGLMGMSKERARQIEEGALVKLRTHLAKGYIRD